MIAEQSFRELESQVYSKIFDESNQNVRMCQNDIKLANTINNIQKEEVCLENLTAASTELKSEPDAAPITNMERWNADDDGSSDGFFSDADDVPLKFSNYSKEKCALPNLQNSKITFFLCANPKS